MVNQARQHCEETRVFTFGLGSGCDQVLCQETAQAGRGSCSIVKDGGKDLNGQVIKALQQATEPSLKNCRVEWTGLTGGQQQLDEVFRNQSIISAMMVPQDKFESLQFRFSSE